MSSSSDKNDRSTGPDNTDTLADALSGLTIAGPSPSQLKTQRELQAAARAAAMSKVTQTLASVEPTTDTSTGQSFGSASLLPTASSADIGSGSDATAASTAKQDDPPAATGATATGHTPPSPASKRSWDGHIRNFAAPKPFNPDCLRDTVQDDTRTDEAGPSDTA